MGDTDWDSDMVSDTPLLDMAMDSYTARGLLMLRPIPTTPTDSDTMVLVTLDTWDTMADSDTMAMDSDTTARGLLMLSLKPRLILTTSDTPDSDTRDTLDTMAMDLDTTARGLLMLSLRPRLILTILDMVLDMDTPDTSDTPDTLDT